MRKDDFVYVTYRVCLHWLWTHLSWIRWCCVIYSRGCDYCIHHYISLFQGGVCTSEIVASMPAVFRQELLEILNAPLIAPLLSTLPHAASRYLAAQVQLHQFVPGSCFIKQANPFWLLNHVIYKLCFILSGDDVIPARCSDNRLIIVLRGRVAVLDLSLSILTELGVGQTWGFDTYQNHDANQLG